MAWDQVICNAICPRAVSVGTIQVLCFKHYHYLGVWKCDFSIAVSALWNIFPLRSDRTLPFYYSGDHLKPGFSSRHWVRTRSGWDENMGASEKYGCGTKSLGFYFYCCWFYAVYIILLVVSCSHFIFASLHKTLTRLQSM